MVSENIDYCKSASYFLLATIALSLVYLMLLLLSPLVRETFLLATLGVGGWLARGYYEQRRGAQLYLQLNGQELERLRDLHRRGDG